MTPSPDIVAELSAALGDGAVVADPDILRAFAMDQARFCPAGTPAALVRPRSTEHVSTVLRVASLAGVPVVPQGARTGLAGGANAVDGCLLLNLGRMDRILSIDPVEQVAVVQPGVVNADLSRAVAGQGLFYPPDPASWETSTIGGNVATNAGGLCCVKYGVTGDFVRALEWSSPTARCCGRAGPPPRASRGTTSRASSSGPRARWASSPR